MHYICTYVITTNVQLTHYCYSTYVAIICICMYCMYVCMHAGALTNVLVLNKHLKYNKVGMLNAKFESLYNATLMYFGKF